MKMTFAIIGVIAGTREDFELRRSLEFPFVPRQCDTIALTEEDDMREVDQIFWDPTEGLVVFFKDQELTQAGLEEMAKLGWNRVT